MQVQTFEVESVGAHPEVDDEARAIINAARPPARPAPTAKGVREMNCKVREKSAAVLTVFDAAEMSPAGAESVARWLEKQARFLRRHNHECAKRFVARYVYDPDAAR
jgi:hypothetical protein